MPLNSTFDDDHFLRLAGIAAHALKECIEGAGTNPSQTVLLLGLREPFRENPYLDGREVDLLRVIQQELGVRFHPDSSILPYGRTAAFQGLQIAHRLLTTNMIEACIIGGVDSYLNEFDLTRFEKSYRILSPSVSRGFIPGEGAAFVAISNQIVHTAKAPFVKIWGVGLANEDAEVTVLSDGHPTGKGLQRALETTLQDANIPESSIAFRVSDLNGESYYGIDSMLAMSRFYKTRREHLEIWHPADCVGDIGAASGALLIILASTGIVKGYAPGSIAMCEASSDGGLRAGCILGLYKV
jgi:3-oxoacyl-[acyl-carrier-protein] synthase-1